jgi:hypothetical protein
MSDAKETYSRSGRKISKVGSGELTAEETANAEVVEMAESLEHGVRCSFRWGSDQLALLKFVADKMGIPYQTYMKQAIYKQCLDDMYKFRRSGLDVTSENLDIATFIEAEPVQSLSEVQPIVREAVPPPAVADYSRGKSRKILVAFDGGQVF